MKIIPVISIIVPCFNQAQFLDEALQSVFEQSFRNWECIIVNDGSPDNTEEVARKWLDCDPRFRYLHQINEGLCSARNSGIKIADGQYILPLDADDRIGSNYLYLALEKFNDNPSIKVVYCSADCFGEINGRWELGTYSIANLAQRNIIFCSAVYKKSDWSRVGGYDKKMIYGLEDWEFWISVLKDGGDVFKITEVCFFYRVKVTSMVKNLKGENLEAMYSYISIKHVEFFVQYFFRKIKIKKF